MPNNQDVYTSKQDWKKTTKSRLRTAIEEKGYTQAKTAELLSLENASRVSRCLNSMENDMFTIKQYVTLANMLDISLDYLAATDVPDLEEATLKTVLDKLEQIRTYIPEMKLISVRYKTGFDFYEDDSFSGNKIVIDISDNPNVQNMLKDWRHILALSDDLQGDSFSHLKQKSNIKKASLSFFEDEEALKAHVKRCLEEHPEDEEDDHIDCGSYWINCLKKYHDIENKK